MQMPQDQAGCGYYPHMSQDQVNELEQMQFDQAISESLHQRQLHCPPTPCRDMYLGDEET